MARLKNSSVIELARDFADRDAPEVHRAFCAQFAREIDRGHEDPNKFWYCKSEQSAAMGISMIKCYIRACETKGEDFTEERASELAGWIEGYFSNQHRTARQVSLRRGWAVKDPAPWFPRASRRCEREIRIQVAMAEMRAREARGGTETPFPGGDEANGQTPELMDVSELTVKKAFNSNRYKVSFGSPIPWSDEDKTWPEKPAEYLKVFQLAGKGEVKRSELNRETSCADLTDIRKQVRPRLERIGYTVEADVGRRRTPCDRIVKISTVSERGTEKVETKK